MKLSTPLSKTLAEVFVFGAFVAWYIWQLQASYFFTWLVFPVWMIASFVVHGDTPKTIGWRTDNLWSATKRCTPFFASCMVGLFFVGVFFGALHRPLRHHSDLKHFFGYMGFCLLQQVGMNSYLTNRLLGVMKSPAMASLLAGTIFAALHWPNPLLIPLTLLGGTVMAWFFAQERNIIPLAIGQGILGTLVWWAFPLAWHHGMRVGPGFYTYHPR
jgi:Type II CAAX prenyl endopeptidase Rce1-like